MTSCILSWSNLIVSLFFIFLLMEKHSDSVFLKWLGDCFLTTGIHPPCLFRSLLLHKGFYLIYKWLCHQCTFDNQLFYNMLVDHLYIGWIAEAPGYSPVEYPFCVFWEFNTLILTHCFLHSRYDTNQPVPCSEKSKVLSLFRSMSWLTVSKPF